MDKKRKRKENKNENMDIDENDLITMEENEKEKEIINIEFIFSNILEENFQEMKVLLKPNYEFEDIYIGDLVNLLIKNNHDVGTTIKGDENIFGLFSYIPLSYYLNEKNHDKIIDKYFSFLNKKINECLKNENEKKNIINLLNDKNNNFGIVINERVINLPEETIPPAYNLICKEINECKECEGYDKQYDFNYFIMISKFVKILNSKKDEQKEAYYKFEHPHFVKKSICNLEYKIPYQEKDLGILENQNEPQYINILFIKDTDYFFILKKELGCDI